MSLLVALAVAVPAIGGAAVVAVGALFPSWVSKLVAIATAATVTVLTSILVVGTYERPIEYAFGGWHPRRGVVIGIVFSVEPVAAASAAVAALLTTASLVYSWRYFEDTTQQYASLMLVFLAGMVGFALSADLFDMFVFFELMGVCAFALTGYDVKRPGPIQGAINFAVTNSLGAFLLLIAIALLYGRTGALNLAQIGRSLAGKPVDGLVVVAFVLLVSGFLVKAGAVPFHFWLSDAYAVAPATVGALLSGAMCDLGISGIERVYWSGFSGAIDHKASVRAVLVGVAATTALVGAVMAFLQSNLKRMLAFVTVSQIGVVLAGVALLTARGLAGATLCIVAQGLVQGGLFLAIGLVLHELRHDDELRLRGLGRRMAPAGILFGVAALAVGGMPPFGPFLGAVVVEQAGVDAGYGWLPVVLAAAAIVSGAALLRAAARIFLGAGSEADALLARQPEGSEGEEGDEPASHRSPVLLLPIVALLSVGLCLTFAPRVAGYAEATVGSVMNRTAYAADVLEGVPPPRPPTASSGLPPAWTWALGAFSTVAAIGLAAIALRWTRRPRPIRRACSLLHAAHTGVIGDYVAWLLAGTAALGGLFALLLT